MTEKTVKMTAGQLRTLYNFSIQPKKFVELFEKKIDAATPDTLNIKVPVDVIEDIFEQGFYFPTDFTKAELQAMYDEEMKPEETIYSKEYEIVMTGAEMATVVAALNICGLEVARSRKEIKEEMDSEMVFADEYQVFNDFDGMLKEIIEGEF